MDLCCTCAVLNKVLVCEPCSFPCCCSPVVGAVDQSIAFFLYMNF